MNLSENYEEFEEYFYKRFELLANLRNECCGELIDYFAIKQCKRLSKQFLKGARVYGLRRAQIKERAKVVVLKLQQEIEKDAMAIGAIKQVKIEAITVSKDVK